MMIFVSLFNIVNNVEEHVETSILLLLMCIAGIITTYLFFRMRNIKRNKRINKENIKIRELKKAIEIRKK